MYAIVKTGGKQYRVEQGQSLLVERLAADDGAKVELEPLLYVDGSEVLHGDDLGKVKVEAKVLAHERGRKLRVVKFKPKRGYRRRTGHRQELTRLEVTAIKLAARRSRGAASSGSSGAPEAEASSAAPEGRASSSAAPEGASATAAREARTPRTRKAPTEKKAPAERKAAAARKAPAQKPDSAPKEDSDGS
jgi:large subunit ribosomal protein L21